MKKQPKNIKVRERLVEIGEIKYDDELSDAREGWRVLIGNKVYKIVAVYRGDSPVYEDESQPVEFVVEFAEYCDKIVELINPS